MDELNHKSIVNLSDFTLNEQHISLLKRGLKFCPTPGPPNPGEMREDMDRVHKRLRQIAYFENPEFADTSFDNSQVNIPDPIEVGDNLTSVSPFKHRKFKLPSTGKGPPGPQNLEAMIANNEYSFDNRPTFQLKATSNLTQGEMNAMAELKSNPNIILRIADKGAAVVLMNRLDYLKEGYRQLGDTKFYQKLDHNPTQQYMRDVNNQIEDMYQNGEIDETVKDYLLVTTFRTPEFYTIPKIHKNPIKGRPIISGNGSPTEKISQFVDHFLNPYTTKLRSYVKDTTHFLQILKDKGVLPPNTLLATLDVSSLYTNINNQDGLDAAKNTLARHRPGTHLKPSNSSLLKLLELVLTRTNFQFNGQNYKQISGIFMGTKTAPSYAINTMGAFESKFVYTYHKKCLVYLRYIDDIFIMWTHTREELLEFIEFLNTRTEHFKFTSEISDKEVTFLDTKVCIQDDHIVTDLYCKPTDSHNYLVYDSSHPQRCKDSIPFSQFLRIRRICTKLDDYDVHVVTYAAHFLRRGYPLELIKEAALMARGLDRDELLSPTTEKPIDKDKVFLITTFHPRDSSLRNIFFQNWEQLGRSPTTDFIHKKKLMCGYRRPKNLRDLLVRAKVPYLPGDEAADPNHVQAEETTPAEHTCTQSNTSVHKQKSILDFFRRANKVSPQMAPPPNPQPGPRRGTNPTQRGFNFCNQQYCRYCPLLNKSGTITSSSTGLKHHSMINISCRSSNLIYTITCRRCKIQYVGQTMLRIKDRFVHHFRDIQISNQDKSVGKHFSLPDHNGFKDMEIYVVEFIKTPPRSPKATIVRRRTERYWTHLLRTLSPQGLNMENPKESGTKK